MCLRVDVVGYSSEEGDKLSIFLHLMKGPYDDKLKQSGRWPMRGKFKIELINQLKDSNHHKIYLSYDQVTSPSSKIVLGEEQFISHSNLLQADKANYVENDTLVFRISYIKNN